MGQKEIANHIAHNFGFTKSVSNTVIFTIFDEIKDAIARGNTIKINKFGTFKSKIANKRNCRNPMTGEQFESLPKKKVIFKPYKSLKNFLNRSILLNSFTIK